MTDDPQEPRDDAIDDADKQATGALPEPMTGNDDGDDGDDEPEDDAAGESDAGEPAADDA